MSKALRNRTTSWFMAAAVFAGPLLPAGAATLPAATFYELVIYPSVELEGDVMNPEVVSVLLDEDWRAVDAAASTWGGARPAIHARTALTVNAPGYERTYYGGASGEIRYYWSLEQVGGDPFDGLVPVEISITGRVQYMGSTGRAGASSVSVRADFTEMGSGQARYFSVTPPLDEHGLPIVGTGTLDERYTAMIEPGRRNRVDLWAGAGGWVTVAGSFAAEAWIDPRIVIAADFARRDDFRLSFSAGVSPVPVPPAALLMASAIAALASPGWRLRRRTD